MSARGPQNTEGAVPAGFDSGLELVAAAAVSTNGPRGVAGARAREPPASGLTFSLEPTKKGTPRKCAG
jgi:hypothetical protein